LCAGCHTNNTSMPSRHPRVDPADHAGGDPCTDCHDPHTPAP
jgi:hypothetical protein